MTNKILPFKEIVEFLKVEFPDYEFVGIADDGDVFLEYIPPR